MKILVWGTVVFGFCLLLPGCGAGAPPSLPRGEVYEDVTGKYRIVVQTETEVDVIEKGSAYQGEYLIQEDGRVRIVVTVFGTSVVQYYEPAEEGLRQIHATGEAGGMLYDRAHIKKPRVGYYCALVEREVEVFKNAQNARYPYSRRGYAVDAASGAKLRRVRNDVQMEFLGVPRRYYILSGTHEQCDKNYIYHSSGDKLETLYRDEAEERWASLKEEVEKDLAEDLQRQAREAEQARRERERLVALREKSRTPTREIGEYRHFNDYRREFSVKLTDVGLERENLFGRKKAEEIWFGDIQGNPTKTGYESIVFNWTGWQVRINKSPLLRPIVFTDEAECDRFYEALVAALEEWRMRYPELDATKR